MRAARGLFGSGDRISPRARSRYPSNRQPEGLCFPSDAKPDRASLAGPGPRRAIPVGGAARWRIRAPGRTRQPSGSRGPECLGGDPISRASCVYLALLHVVLLHIRRLGVETVCKMKGSFGGIRQRPWATLSFVIPALTGGV